ncbi:MAG: hypothetical protein J6X58_04820 [Bacteroidales bacterium]|nr:hypothetical protein [Bacteroidales bacterium]
MKTRKIFVAVAIVSLVLTVGACKKSRYCHCVSDYYTIVINADTVSRADTAVVNVDRSMKCEHIKELTFRTKDEGPVVLTDREVKCVELDVDTVRVLP